MARMVDVTLRQAATFALAVALGAGAVAAAAVDQPAAAAAAAGVATSATLAAVVQLRRRLSEVEVRRSRAVETMVGNLERELVHRLNTIEFGQRRLLAAVEAARLAAADCRCRERAAHGDRREESDQG